MFYYLNYGATLSPDLVITTESDYELIAQNPVDTPTFDAAGNILLQTPKSGESRSVAWWRSISRHSKLLVNLYNRLRLLNSAWEEFRATPFVPAVGSQALQTASVGTPTSDVGANVEDERWQTKEKILGTFAQKVEADGAHFLLTSWTGSWVDSATAAEIPAQMQDIARRGHFSYTNLVPAFTEAEATTGISGIFACDWHWNTAGNRYVADALYRYLKAHPKFLSTYTP
jgi:hypothetical protein